MLAAKVHNGERQNEPEEEMTAVQAMSEFLENEREMWLKVKSSQFYKNMCNNKNLGISLPLRDWLRLLLQVDTSLSISEILRIVDEEDTVLSMSSVCSTPLAYTNCL